MKRPSLMVWVIALMGSLGVHAAGLLLSSGSPAPADIGGAGEPAPVWGVPGSLFDVEGVEDSGILEAVRPSPTEKDAPVEPSETQASETVESEQRELLSETETAEASEAPATPPNALEAANDEPRPVEEVEVEENEVTQTRDVARLTEIATEAETEPLTVLLSQPDVEQARATEQSDTPTPAEVEASTIADIQPVVPIATGSVAIAVPVEATETIEPASPDVAEVTAETPPPIPLPNPRMDERREAERREAARRETEPQEQQSRQAAIAPSAAPRQQNTGSGSASGSSARSRSTVPGQAEISNYSGRVLSHLQRRKRYPRGAARKRLAGAVGLRFTIDSAGRVTAARVTRSSGHDVFDQEVLAMVRRANPFPAMPANFNRSSMSFTVTIRFAPR